jgi:hypothetical protein
MTKKILQVGGDSYLDNEGVYEGEYANTKVLEKLPGYASTRLWGSNGKLTKSNIAKGFKSNVDFVDFCGHGSWASWSTHPPNDDDTWIPPKEIISPFFTGWLYFEYDLYMVNNAKKLPVIVLKSCSNHKYTESAQCLGWKALSKKNGGGIASFAAAGIGYGTHGYEVVNYFTGWMEVQTFDELFNNKILGHAWANCITGYYNTYESDLDKEDWKTLLEWSMFGDPTLVIQDGDDPINLPRNKPVLTGVFKQLINYFQRLTKLTEQLIQW